MHPNIRAKRAFKRAINEVGDLHILWVIMNTATFCIALYMVFGD